MDSEELYHLAVSSRSSAMCGYHREQSSNSLGGASLLVVSSFLLLLANGEETELLRFLRPARKCIFAYPYRTLVLQLFMMLSQMHSSTEIFRINER
jgi:hypothetical protein